MKKTKKLDVRFMVWGVLSMNLHNKTTILLVPSAGKLSYVVHQVYKDTIKLDTRLHLKALMRKMNP